MFSKEEIKGFSIRLGKKWFFPDFSNKLTWYVATIGAGIILTPTPLKLIFYNWLVDTFNLNYGQHFTLSEISSNAAEYWIGFALIMGALFHNVSSKWINLQETIDQGKEKEIDKKMFVAFLSVFASSSRSAHLLQTHDFGNSFHNDALKEIEQFVIEWNCPEKSFLDPDINKLKSDLWEKSNEFCNLISIKSSPTSSGLMLSVVSDQYRHDWEWPDWIKKDVEEVNNKATELFNIHQNFIREAKEKLKC